MVLAAILSGGCASQSVEIGVTTRAETYLPIDDRNELLTANPPRCAVLPAIMTGTNPGRGIAADMAIDQALERSYGPGRFTLAPEADRINVIRHFEVIAWCVEHDLLDELQKLLETHGAANYPDPDLASKIAEGLGVQYLVFPRITGISTDNAGRFTFTGLTFIRTGWISMEGTLQIWDARSRGIAWQSAGQCSLTAENVVGISPPVQSAMDALFTTLIGDFATNRTASIVNGTLDDSEAANPTNTSRTTPSAAKPPRSESVPTAPGGATDDPAIGHAVEEPEITPQAPASGDVH